VEDACLRITVHQHPQLQSGKSPNGARHTRPGQAKPAQGVARPGRVCYLENGGRKALIAEPEHISGALEGKLGTWIDP